MRDPLRNVSVRYKLALTFAGVCLLAFGVGGYLVSHSAMRALESEILERLEFQADAHATALDGGLRALGQRARDFASDGYIRTQFEALGAEEDPERLARLERELRTHLLENKLPIVPAFLDLALAGWPREDLFLAEEQDAEWARAVLGEMPAEGDFLGALLPADTADEHPTFALATPLLSLRGERRIGSLLVKVHPGVWVANALEAMHVAPAASGSGPTLELVDASGTALVIPRALTESPGVHSGADLVRTGFGLRLERGSERESTYAPVRGVFSRRIPLSAGGWSVALDLASQDALAAVSGLQARFVIVGLLLTGAASLILFFPMRFLAGPLIGLRDAARRIKDGDFRARVAVETTDEIGDLSRSFNLMAEAVEERTSKLHKAAVDLEQRKDELSQERDRLNAVISSMRDGLMVLDADGRPEVWNTAARPLIEMVERDALEPSVHRICGNAESRPASSCGDCLFDPHAPPRSCLVDIGSSVYEVHSTRLAADTEGRSGRVLVARDVSDRMERDQREIHQERLAVLGEVAAVVAHELNNPLAAITMFNQMLAAELDEESPLHENVEVIERNAQTCKRTIRELLDYSTGATPEVGLVDVHATLEDVARFLRALCARNETELVLELEAESPLVEGDEVQLRQIFVNLVMNAAQAADGAGRNGDSRRRVIVRTAVEPGHLLVEVRDEGPGIPAELTEEIFRPFFTTKPRGSGTGLGLPTARRIAELQGGGLELLDGRPGATTFQVRLLRSAS